MSKKKYDVVAVIGKYKDKNGEEKSQYLNCGVVIQGEKGFSMKLNAIPITPEWNGWFSLFEPREKTQSKPGPAPRDDFVDQDIPF